MDWQKSVRLLWSTSVVLVSGFLYSPNVCAQVAPPPKVCTSSHTWFQCAARVKQIVKGTDDVKVALQAATEWAQRYDALCRANAQATWPWSDQEMLEHTLEKIYDDALGKYLDPASLAFGLALAKYLPKLAAILEFAGSAATNAFFVLLAPSPITNDFVAASQDDKEINELLVAKMPAPTVSTIREHYLELFNKAYVEIGTSKQTNKP